MSEKKQVTGPSLLNAEPEDERRSVITEAPPPHLRLGFFSTACLIVNRMIGTGIFNSPATVTAATGSIFSSLMLWCIGTLYCLCGVYVYMEYGLNTPRHYIDNANKSVSRSGGDLGYLQYVYRKPRYENGIITLIGCIFGITFICIGNSASNSISFAMNIFQAVSPDAETQPTGTIRAIALTAATVACFPHAFSRRGGIFLNNAFACIKILILLLIIITAILVPFGVFQGAKGGESTMTDEVLPTVQPVPSSNSIGPGATGYAEAIISIIFTFSGFDQPNHALGEVARPRQTLPRAMFLSASLVCLLYLAVNISFMMIVPQEKQAGTDITYEFFGLTLGQLEYVSPTVLRRIVSILVAISSLGNIIVMTYTASRMKQEIAKQGILPFSLFFARDYDISLGRLLLWLNTKGLALKFMDPLQHSEKTPVGAILLHLFSSFVFILATSSLSAVNAYVLLSALTSYIPAIFGVFLAFGILWLHFHGPPKESKRSFAASGLDCKAPERTWAQMTEGTTVPWVSKTCASLYLVGNLVPVIISWIPHQTSGQILWFVGPSLCWGVLAFASLWWVVWMGWATYKKRMHNRVFVYHRVPEFDNADEDDHNSELDPEARQKATERDGLLASKETVYLYWQSEIGA